MRTITLFRQFSAISMISLSLMGNAHALDGKRFLERCSNGMPMLAYLSSDNVTIDPEIAMSFEICYFYIAGMVDRDRLSQQLFCPPETATYLQMYRVVHKWLSDNPQRLHRPHAVLVAKALTETFPCQRTDLSLPRIAGPPPTALSLLRRTSHVYWSRNVDTGQC